MHRVWGEEEHETITRGRQGNGPPVEAGRGGGGGRVDDGCRQRYEGTLRRENPLGLTGT